MMLAPWLQRHVAPILWQSRRRGAFFPVSWLLDAQAPGHRRSSTVATALAAQRAERGSTETPLLTGLTSDDSVHAAIDAAVASLGRQPGAAEQQLAQRLEDNWYSTAGAVGAMSQGEVAMVGLPLRLWAAVRQLLEEGAQPAGGAGGSQGAAHADAAAELEWAAASQPPAPLAAPPAAAGALVALVEPLPPDIMQRRMPPAPQRVRGLAAIRVTRRKRGEPYGLRDHQMTPQLQAELTKFEKFCTGRWLGQVVAPVAMASHKGNERYLRLLLGWLHQHKGVPLDQLSLASAFPTSEAQGVALVFEWCQWLATERRANARTQFNALSSCIHAVRFLFHDTCYPAGEGALVALQDGAGSGGGGALGGGGGGANGAARSGAGGGGGGGTSAAPYSSVPVMRALRRLRDAAHKEAKKAPLVADESMKWLDWDDFLLLVAHLRRECAGLTAEGTPRPRRQVAMSLQQYLMFAVLACVPDRQRTLRELEVGRTLLKEGDRWLIRHSPGDYKTGKLYGERPPLVLAAALYPELEAFIDTWRQELAPVAPTLFVNPNTGLALTDRKLYDDFVATARRVTGKPTNPHLVRDMIVTYLRSRNTSVAELEALAIYMGHSMEMQRNTYDRRTRAQKVTPAIELLEAMTGKALR